MTQTVSVWLKISNLEQTCGFYQGRDQKNAFLESSGRLHRPQVDGFVKNESKKGEDEILTASVKIELKGSNPVFDIPEEYAEKCIGTGIISRSTEESLRGRKVDCFRVDLNLLADEQIIQTLVALRKEWFRLEAICYLDRSPFTLDDIKNGGNREVLIERYKIYSNIEQ